MQAILCSIVSGILERPMEDRDMAGVLRQVRLERMARLLHLYIARMAQPADREQAVALLDAMDDTRAQALLESPALCEIVRTGRPPAELLALMQRPDFHPPLPARLANPTAGLRQPFIPDSSEQAQSHAAIHTALAALKAATPFGHGVYADLVADVVLRGDSARRSECWGASSGAAIGRVAVINALSSPSPGQLAEVLLHEATHCALDCAELAAPLAALDTAASPSTPSPWTGNPLTPHALIHASVVWAVLHEYWRASTDRQQADARLAFIERGFRQLDGGHLGARAAAAVELARRSVCPSPPHFTRWPAASITASPSSLLNAP